jgi:hypothetical protein
MNRRSLLAVGLASLALLATGCRNSWRVVAEAHPDPFIGQRNFGLVPIDYTNLHVGTKSEAQYLSEKAPENQQSFQIDKEALNEEFARSLIDIVRDDGINIVLASGPGDAPFTIRPFVTSIEPGFYAYIANKPSYVEMALRITTPDGAILDEILLEHSTPATLTNPSSGGRLRADGSGLGKTVARYLLTRVKP